MSVPLHGLTQLGFRAHSSGLSAPEATTASLSFFGSDQLVYTTTSIRPAGPCHPNSAMAGPIFSYFWNSNPDFPGGLYDFCGRLYTGVGLPYGGFPNFRYLDPTGCRLHISCLELKTVISALHHWVSVLQGRQVSIATDNTTVVSCTNKEGPIPYPCYI